MTSLRSRVHARLVTFAVAILAVAGACSSSSGQTSAPPVRQAVGSEAMVRGPIAPAAQPGDPSHDYVFYATPMDLKKVGYVEQEYFVSGTATRFPSNPANPMTNSAPMGTMPYTTRIVVRRPADPSRFTGVVVVDWQNVTAGHDIDTEWSGSGDFFVRSGWAWVGASVQRVGVNGAAPGPTAGLGLKQWGPTRYAPLDLSAGGTVNDDSQSFDVFSQIGALARHAGPGVDPFKGMNVRHVYAAGVSQSARFLVLYYNTVQQQAKVYDGLLVGLGGPRVRTDVATKMLRVNTETDVWRGQGDPAIRIGDTSYVHEWEIAGGSHVPAAAVSTTAGDPRANLGWIQEREFGQAQALSCVNPGPSDVEDWAVFHSAYSALDRWVSGGQAPPKATPIQVSGPNPAPAGTWSIVRDAGGLAVGGIRLPKVAVPVALNNGENAPASLSNPLNGFCVLYGTHRSYDAAKLASLYGSHAAFVSRVTQTVDTLEKQGFLLRADGDALLQSARSSDAGI
ncbi:MAG TPA: alpha/beta hydrolase domain-containing protein [Candidatus Dormibacteraeota bacterium]|nr:alpha/beta hydrolase domain-containing protein [Candidatus Dormibacteraeota bacterium]